MKKISTLLLICFLSNVVLAQTIEIISNDAFKVKGNSGYEYIGEKEGKHYIYNWQNIIVLNEDFKVEKEIDGLAKLWHTEMRFFGDNIACIAGDKEILAYNTDGGAAWGEKLKPYGSSGQSGYVSTASNTSYLINENNLFVSGETGSNVVSFGFGKKDISANYVINCYDLKGDEVWTKKIDKGAQVVSNFISSDDENYIFVVTEKETLGDKTVIKIDAKTGKTVASKVLESSKEDFIRNVKLVYDTKNNKINLIAFRGVKDGPQNTYSTGIANYIINPSDLTFNEQKNLSFEALGLLPKFQDTQFNLGDPKYLALSKKTYPKILEFGDIKLDENGDILVLIEHKFKACSSSSSSHSQMATPSNPSGTTTSSANCVIFNKSFLVAKIKDSEIDENIKFIRRSAETTAGYSSFGKPFLFEQNNQVHVLFFNLDKPKGTKKDFDFKIASFDSDFSSEPVETILSEGIKDYLYELEESFFDEKSNQIILLGSEKGKELVVSTIKF